MSDTYQIKAALESPETKATVLHAVLRSKYGHAFYDWDISTIVLELQDDFHADVSDDVVNRISALQLLMTTDVFFNRLDAFMGICNTLASGDPAFDVFDPVTLEESAWAITEAGLNREVLPFSYAIRAFIKQLLREEGFVYEYPWVFEQLFDAGTKSEADDVDNTIRENLADTTYNGDNLTEYIKEEFDDIVYQLGQISTLRNVDNILLENPDKTIDNIF